MSLWSQGEAELEQQLAAGELQQVTGGQADGRPLLEKARRTIDTANEESDRPEAQQAIQDARSLIDAAEQLLDELKLF